MQASLPSAPFLTAFLAASFVLAVTPAPGVLYILTRGATQGRAAGLASVAGVALGNLGNAAAASLGLAAVFAASALAFTAVKYLGAAYLIYLGIHTLRSRGAAPRSQSEVVLAPADLRRVFGDGLVVPLFNPKTAIFFAAFLPQFLPAAAGPLELLGLGGIFVAIAAMTDTAYAMASGAIKRWLSRGNLTSNFGRYASGSILIPLGVLTAVTGQRSKA